MNRISILLLSALLLGSACSRPATHEAVFSLDGASGTAFSEEGGTFTVTARWEYCRYKVSTDADFVGLPAFVYIGDAEGTGSRELAFSVDANASPEVRTARLDFKPVDSPSGTNPGILSITLSQAGKPRETVSVTLDAGKAFQTWDGFGAMNLGANWSRPVDWSEGETDTFIGQLGLNIIRIRIPHDEKDWAVLREGCRYAWEKYGALLLASPWTMPAPMKVPQQLEAKKNDVTSSLAPASYEAYALYLEKFASYMQEGGIPLSAISVQNEPDWPATYEGCVWTADQHLSFIRDYGQLVRSARLVTGESMQTTHSFYDPVLRDETACSHIAIVGGHLYGVKPQTYALAAEKGKRLWMTEHLYDESWSKGTDHWTETMEVVKEIHGCLTTGWNAYIWWYGARYYSLIGDGNEGTTRGKVLPRGYAYAQFSKYIRPGDTRIGTDVSGTGSETLLATAFQGSDHLSVILVNTAGSEKDVTVDLGRNAAGAGATCTCASASATDLSVTVQGSTVVLELPPMSVTSLSL